VKLDRELEHWLARFLGMMMESEGAFHPKRWAGYAGDSARKSAEPL
jgi:hypothetical protein